MSTLSSTDTGLSVRRLGLLGAVLALSTVTALVRSDGPPAAEASRKPAGPLQQARNPVQLSVLVDSAKVLGWVSGDRDHTGEAVEVRAPGKHDAVPLQRGNTFTWAYRVDRPTQATFTFGNLKQTVTLTPPAKLPPSVFFVVDRSVYRPSQALQFAGFLRELGPRGDFVPLPQRTVEVLLTADKKKTVAARLKFTSDEEGRITGRYTFANADPLDHYRLSIRGYKGEAHITLAEYRKSKVHLDITSRRDGSRLDVRFQARDYLDKPVTGGKVRLVAQIVRDPYRPEPGPLDGKQFAYAGDGPQVLRLEDLSLDERLLVEEDDPQSVTGLSAGRERQVVAEIKGQVDLGKEGEGTYHLQLKKGWQEPGHAVVVQGVLIDGHGREERRTRTIPLTRNDGRLQLSLSRPSFETRDAIRVTASTTDPAGLRGAGALVAMRLTAEPLLPRHGFGGQFSGVPPGFQFGTFPGQFGGLSGVPPGSFGGFGGLSGGFGGFGGINGTLPVANLEVVHRTLATAVVFRGDTATLRLREPGAYALLAVWHRPDGTRWRQEVGCTVRSAHAPPPLTLHLDRDTYRPGDALTGTVHSKYADACVLLTVRDGVGLRLWKTLRLSGGRAEINIPLPAGLHYGCAAEVQYADAPPEREPVHVASRFFHVVPADRMLTIQSRVKPVCEPGEKVAIDLEVNRKEPVDLIVSVYDQALLGIAPDRSADVRSFYLADDRVYQGEAREVLRRRLGGLTLADLERMARAWRKAQHPPTETLAETGAVMTLEAGLTAGRITTPDLATLLRVAGIKARAVEGARIWQLPTGKDTPLRAWEWLDKAEGGGWRLHFSLLGDTLLLSAYQPHHPKPWASGPGVFPYPIGFTGMMGMGSGFQGNFGGMMGMTGGQPRGGFAGMGGLGGIGGIAGIGGGGFNLLGAQGGMGGIPQMGVAGFGGFQGSPSHLPGMGFNASPSFLVQAPVAPKGRAAVVLLSGDNDQPGLQVRRDFSDSAYWNARVRTDAAGRARVEVPLPDSLTSWRVVVTAVSRDLHVGRHETSFQTARPVMVNPILPRFFAEGDTVQVSAGVHNRTDTRQAVRVRLKVENGKVHTPAEREVTLEPKGSAVVYWTFQAGDPGFTQLLMSAEAKAGSDASLKRLPVVRAGVEQVVTQSGFCKGTAEIKVPDGVDPAQAVLEVRFAPSLTADLLDTLDYLVEYPYGCVEQTMSRFLPAIKVAQVLKRARLDHPGLTKKLPGCVDAGIKRLLELQQPDGGWAWHGNGQTHEMMTPYALYGLLEAEKAGYALGSEDAVKRGLDRLRLFIEQMGPRQAADRIFCMYVYGHRHDLPAGWWQFVEEQRAAHNLSDYALALALDLAVQQKQTKLADRLAADLRQRAREAGGQVHWQTAGFSRWGDDPLEITAAALKALVAYDKEDRLIPGVLAYFAATKQGNRWNSTKCTATIVYALCDYLARQEVDPRGRPRVAFQCNDGPAQEVPFAGPAEGHKVVVPAGQVRAGVNRITFTEGSPGMMYRAALRYWVSGRSAGPQDHGIRVARRFWLLNERGKRGRELKSGDVVPRGAYLESTVEATAADLAHMRFVLVENPRPACCEVVPVEDKRFEQQGTPCVLREERETVVAFHHEETAGQIIDRCVLHAEMAGDYLVPAAHVEMMYRTEVRGHSGTFHLRVAEK